MARRWSGARIDGRGGLDGAVQNAGIAGPHGFPAPGHCFGLPFGRLVVADPEIADILVCWVAYLAAAGEPNDPTQRVGGV
jgi:hypothetical protein